MTSEIQHFGLSAREWQVLALMARGLDDAVIARWLYISESTVRRHIERIYEKLGIRHLGGLPRVVAVLRYERESEYSKRCRRILAALEELEALG